MKEAKIQLRKAVRRNEAISRESKMKKIMDNENSTKSFHALVRMQRKTDSSQTRSLTVNGTKYDSSEGICSGWQDHFHDLATPKDNPKFDESYLNNVKSDLLHIEEICHQSSKPIDLVTEEEIRKALAKLKNNKAADAFGLMSEHFSLCINEISPVLVVMVNGIFRLRKVPDLLKEAILTPVYKKGDATNPSNYRGISVTPVILKIVEHILSSRHNPSLQTTQSRLQKGFTENTSSMNAAMILSECIQESKQQKKPLFVAALDVQKAFDVVDHDSLLRKLYLDGISGDDWLLMKDLYTNMSAKVKWDGFLSSTVVIRQGVRQGGILSAPHYKRYNNSFLLDIEDRFCGKLIGTVRIPHVTVADDLCFITEDLSELQPVMTSAELQANREHYTIHPTKTVILNYDAHQEPNINLYGDTVPVEDLTVHLGVSRSIKCTPNIDEKVNLGRRSAYSLMGAGFHGKSGLKQSIKANMWMKYVVPRLVYGLEVLSMRKKDTTQLEAFQRRSMKQIQNLPLKTSDTAALALLGILPISACIEKNILSLFGRVVRDQSSIENDIAVRQLAVRSISEKSWFSSVRIILNTYDLPSAYELLENPPTKEQWKKSVKTKIHEAVEQQWHDDIKSKSSLRYLNPGAVKIGKVHQVYASVRNNTYDVRRAEVKVRLLTGTYTLQSNRAKFNQYNVSPTCQLCNKNPETREHFITVCESLKNIRLVYLNKIRSLFEHSSVKINSLLADSARCTQLLLDSSHPDINNILQPDSSETEFLELYSRELLFKLHLERTKILSDNKTREHK